MSARPEASPPFWELEDLLAAGLACETALAVMAARRGGPRLVDDADAGGTCLLPQAAERPWQRKV